MHTELIGKSHGWFREWFRKIWDLRGGGLYACGFAITFVVLEIRSLADDILGIGAIFEGRLFGNKPGAVEASESSRQSASE